MNIYLMAFILIYSDGYVDYIPVKKGVYNHVKYLYDYLRISKRFQTLVQDNHFKFDWVHEYNMDPILKLLARNNVITMFNPALSYVVDNQENADAISGFCVIFPEEYQSHLGLHFASKTISKLDENRYELDKYRTSSDKIDEFDPEEYESFFKENAIKKEEEKKL